MKRIQISRKGTAVGRSRATMMSHCAAGLHFGAGRLGGLHHQPGRRGAGVNIASLCQYFPNKRAILLPCATLTSEESRQAVLWRAPRVIPNPLAAMVRTVIMTHQVAPAHRAFTEELPAARVLPGGRCMVTLSC